MNPDAAPTPADRPVDAPIVVFGGTFDPPHRRHVDLLRGVDALLRAKQSLVVPAWRNPQRGEPGASGKDRFAMASLAFGGMPGVVVSPMELDLGGRATRSTPCAGSSRCRSPAR